MADDGPAVQVDVDQLRQLSTRFGEGGRTVAAAAGGVDRAMPAVPEDEHDLVRRFVALDEARERFDLSLAAVLSRCGGRLSLVADAASAADADGAAGFRGGPDEGEG
jgi:hypothetical protein